MVKYAMKWEFEGKSGVAFFIEDAGMKYKVSEEVFTSAENVLNLGFKNVFYDKEKKTSNVSFSFK